MPPAAGECSKRLNEALTELEDARGVLERERVARGKMEAELRLSHRLEAVGQLAAGVAHEINTPIQYVRDSVVFLQESFVQFLPLHAAANAAVERLRSLGDEEGASALESAQRAADVEYLIVQVPKALDRTFDGVNRVAEIVRAMKAFAHPGTEEPHPADLNAAIRNTLAVTRNEYKYVADLEVDLAELPPVRCRIGELNQVFLNLVVNAAHAMSDASKGGPAHGVLRVTSRLEGSTVVVEVADTGKGVSPDIAGRIFDPFFTTKPVGKGTGQGLTIALSIVASHGGTLSHRPASPRGTVFTLTLPLDGERK